MRTRLVNIKYLVQTEVTPRENHVVKGQYMKILPVIEHAFLTMEDGLITEFGSMASMNQETHVDQEINVNGGSVLPTWCDSHTHLVFSHSREHEFEDRINGLSYEQIAQRGGGILNSAKRLNETSESELIDLALKRLDQVRTTGTGAIEIKSGYGLCTEGELKMLRVIQQLKSQSDLTIKSTFLAGHAYPLEYRENHQGFIDLIIHDMLPKVADEGLAEYIDVFCEKGFFSVDETDQILEAGVKYGLKPKVHANQLYNSGGIQVGVKHNAISVDHLETMDEAEITCLLHSNTIPTLLPGAAFFLAMHYQPARKIIDAGLPVALASDYNPGSCPSGNMNFIVSLACSQMKMTPEEAINACTINGAAALEVDETLGSIAVGKKANLMITQAIPSLAYLPYSFGENLIERVIIGAR